MQSAVITAPQQVEIQQKPVPEPDSDEVRIRLEGCGLCCSDLPVWEGREWFSYPAEPGSPGHEGWGVVDAVGENVKTIHRGYRVTGLCYNAYAEYDVAKETEVVELPDSLSNQPFPGEPLGCAMNIFRRSEIKQNMTVAIVGIGWLGSMLVQLAKYAGATVIALSRRNSSLRNADRFGADHVWNIRDKEDDEITGKVKEVTEGDLCDRVIETAGKQHALTLAAKLTGVRGRLVIAGYHQDGERTVNMQMWNWRGIDVINAHERDSDEYIKGMREAVKYISRGILDPFSLVTHTFPPDRIQQAFKMQQEKPEGFTKALIRFDR